MKSNYRWSFFDDFLMSSLDTAISLVQVHIVLVLVAKDLHFDVSRPLDKLLDEHLVVVERLESLGLGRVQLRDELVAIERNTHALASAAADRFDHDRVADALGLFEQALLALIGLVVALNDRNVSIAHYELASTLDSHVTVKIQRN
jgi:hypothetical protein